VIGATRERTVGSSADESRPPVDWNGYAARWKALHGGYDPTTAGPPVRIWLKLAYRIARALARLGVSPALVTLVGLATCLSVPVVASRPGTLAVLSGPLVLVAGLLDSLDGALAVVTRRVTRFGYVYDSLVARLGEACWLLGFRVLGVPGWLVALTGCLVFLHEYLRARAVSAGLSGLGMVTVAERPTRVLLCAVGLSMAGACALISSTLATGAGTLLVAIWLLLGLGGFLQLFAAVRRGLT
jgi:phosphatidylglycerophosphate synthase